MKKILPFLFIISCTVILYSCQEDNKLNLSTSPDDLCSVIPEGWECSIITENFDLNDIPKNADTPVAIIKFSNPNIEFTRYIDTKFNPSLTLVLYPIKRKVELIGLIKSQRMYSWCIPTYYGETKNYFIVTSPCFINGGSFTDEANNCIYELHEALKSIITIEDYNDN